MDEPTLARAVEPFFTTKGVGKGTGLGLSMCMALPSNAGGGWFCRAKRDRERRLSLRLPIAEVESDSVAERAAEDGGSVRPLRITVVDDDSLVLTNFAAMLEDLGHEVIEAAIEELRSRLEQAEQVVSYGFTRGEFVTRPRL